MKKCNHVGTKKDRLPILSNWYYCHKCKIPFNKNPKIKMQNTHTKIEIPTIYESDDYQDGHRLAERELDEIDDL